MSDRLLSTDLLNGLSGKGVENILVWTKRKRPNDVCEKVITKDCEQARPSKSVIKKQEQIRLKKEKESKRCEYLKLIAEHSISGDQRKLLVCSKSIGQQDTKRRRLKRCLSKRRAGIVLNECDQHLLFPSDIEGRLFSRARSYEKKFEGEIEPSHVCALSDTSRKAGVSCGSESVKTDIHDSSNMVSSRNSEVTNYSTQIGNIASRGRLSPFKKSDKVCKVVDNVTNDAREHFIPSKTVIPISKFGKVTGSKKGESFVEAKNARIELVNRDPSIQENRLRLPVCSMEQEIVEAISSNDVVIICGETGSGKSTQVPQFLYEYGLCSSGLIGITQPRRVAVTSTANRVAQEMGCPLGDCSQHLVTNLVGYQVRHDASTLNSDMKIKFMTDGILLKEISSDILLKKYSVIILDEAHERNINTDVLLGMLSRTIPLRKRKHEEELAQWLKIPEIERKGYQAPMNPLHLVIMSATLRVNDFLNERLFSATPPVIKVESRQHAVKIHFAKRTVTDDYLDYAFEKVCSIHKKLPPGGILLFLTGKQEIVCMCHRLLKELNGNDYCSEEWDDTEQEELEGGLLTTNDKESIADSFFLNPPVSSLVNDTISPRETQKKGVSTPVREERQDDDKSATRETLLREATGSHNSHHSKENVVQRSDSNTQGAVVVLPLYALLPPDRQKMVFKEPPNGCRLIVVATNVAETSITIPGIRYVVDCGRQKERVIDTKSGISKYTVSWISKASANQRAGRAGRTGPGHCYRLYSPSFYHHHMADYQEPEISSLPLEDLVLQMRAIGIGNVAAFPFPTPPPATSLNKAEMVLSNLGALRKKAATFHTTAHDALKNLCAMLDDKSVNVSAEEGAVTKLGKKMSKFPINARLAKMLIVAHKAGNIPLGICISMIVCLSENTIFCTHGSLPSTGSIDEKGSDSESNGEVVPDSDIDFFTHPTSDILARVTAFGAFSHFSKATSSSAGNKVTSSGKDIVSFCESRSLHYPTLCRCCHLFKQLSHICEVYLMSGVHLDVTELPPPNEMQETALRQIILTGYTDSVARRVPSTSPIFASNCSRRKKLTAYLSCDPNVNEPLFIHPRSALYQIDPLAPLPEFIVYTELIRSEDGQSTYMSGVTKISASWIPELARDCPLLQWSAPLTYPAPYYDKRSDNIKCFASCTYGIHKWELPLREIDMIFLCNMNYYGIQPVCRWFGRFLLEGKLASRNSALRTLFCEQNLLCSPSVVTDGSNKRADSLVRSLVKNEVYSLPSLREQLSINSEYLLNDLLPFFKEKFRQKFAGAWKKNTL